MSYTFVVADLHGRLDLLLKALAKIVEYSPNGGHVVFTGDYIDRGPDSKGVISCLMKGPPQNWKWTNLMGNHEQMLLMTVQDTDRNLDWWVGNGGGATLKSYNSELDKDHVTWIRNLTYYFTDTHRVYVHAALNEDFSLLNQKLSFMLWERYYEEDVGYRGKHVVHGHTPHKEPELLINRTNLDTGSYHTGRLVVGVFDDDKAGGPVDLIEVT